MERSINQLREEITKVSHEEAALVKRRKVLEVSLQKKLRARGKKRGADILEKIISSEVKRQEFVRTGRISELFSIDNDAYQVNIRSFTAGVGKYDVYIDLFYKSKGRWKEVSWRKKTVRVNNQLHRPKKKLNESLLTTALQLSKRTVREWRNS